MTNLASRLEALEATVAQLSTRIAELESRLQSSGSSSSSATVNVHLNTGPSTPSPAEGAPASPAPSSGTSRPAPVTPTANLDSQVKHYVLFSANPEHSEETGTYKTYQCFADAARDHSVVWNGRGKFSWHPQASGQGFPNRREAERHYRLHVGLRDELPVPHWG